MPTIITHAAFGAALIKAVYGKSTDNKGHSYWRTLVAAAVLAMLPDIDSVGFFLGVPYKHLFGHRGFTHSIVFALLVSFVALIPVWKDGWSNVKRGLLFFIVTVSHPLFDMLTDAGLGCAIFAPFNKQRYFFSDDFRGIDTSPIGFNGHVFKVLLNEALILGPLILVLFLSPRSFIKRAILTIFAVIYTYFALTLSVVDV